MLVKGSIVAIVTPMKANGDLDLDALDKLVDFHIESGTKGIIAVGTTGESATLEVSEHISVIERIVKRADKKAFIFAGTGANSTKEAIYLSMAAKSAGADASLSVTPYYNKPTQEGLFQHYKKINDNVGIPIIIYNIPSRSVINMEVDTMAKLYELKNIKGVKDATGDLNRVDQQLKAMGKDFIQLTGNDDNALEFNKRGGVGAISVTANIAPKLCSDFQKLSIMSDEKSISEAERLDKILQPVHHSMFIESNPSPVKYAARLLDLCDDEVRLPLVKITDPTKEIVNKALLSAKLI